MNVLLVITIVHKTNSVLIGLELLFVNVLVAMNCWMESVKVIEIKHFQNIFTKQRLAHNYVASITT